VSIGDVTAATQAQMGLLAAAICEWWRETNLTREMAFFAELASKADCDMGDTDLASIEAGEIE